MIFIYAIFQCGVVVDFDGECGTLVNEGPWLFVGMPNMVEDWNLISNTGCLLNLTSNSKSRHYQYFYMQVCGWIDLKIFIYSCNYFSYKKSDLICVMVWGFVIYVSLDSFNFLVLFTLVYDVLPFFSLLNLFFLNLTVSGPHSCRTVFDHLMNSIPIRVVEVYMWMFWDMQMFRAVDVTRVCNRKYHLYYIIQILVSNL